MNCCGNPYFFVVCHLQTCIHFMYVRISMIYMHVKVYMSMCNMEKCMYACNMYVYVYIYTHMYIIYAYMYVYVYICIYIRHRFMYINHVCVCYLHLGDPQEDGRKFWIPHHVFQHNEADFCSTTTCQESGEDGEGIANAFRCVLHHERTNAVAQRLWVNGLGGFVPVEIIVCVFVCVCLCVCVCVCVRRVCEHLQ